MDDGTWLVEVKAALKATRWQVEDWPVVDWNVTYYRLYEITQTEPHNDTGRHAQALLNRLSVRDAVA
jgi:hypothetical protein